MTPALLQIARFLARQPWADHLTVFGSALSRPDEANDLDVCLHLPDPWAPRVPDAPDLDPALSSLLGLARSRLGYLDPFALQGTSLSVRDEEAAFWVPARRARELKAAIAHGEAFPAWYARVVVPRLMPALPAPLQTIQDRLRPHLDPHWLQPEWQARWTPANPTLGFCAIASEAAFFLLGGAPAGWTSWAVREPDGTSHWWLQHREGQRFDPTADQFYRAGRVPPYERGHPGRPCGFQGMRVDEGSPYGFDRRPSRMAQKLLDALSGPSPRPTPVPLRPRRRGP